MKLSVVDGDITQLDVEVVVNAANNALAGGGGVDGAIHRAAGPALPKACRMLGGCPTGEVRETPGFDLKAKSIFHTVGPVWQGGLSREPELLASCYRSCLSLADERGFVSMAFPAISCGVYGFPAARAVEIAVDVSWGYAVKAKTLREVTFCCFGAEMADLYRKKLNSLQN